MDSNKYVMVRCILISLLLYGGSQGFAQSISRQSVNSAGGNEQLKGLVIRQSVGQPYFTGTRSAENVHVRPGFQQPTTLKIKATSVESTFTFQVNVFPNPATTSLDLKTSEILSGAKVAVRDLNGNLIWQEEFSQFNNTRIRVEDWSEGVYLMTLSNTENQQQHTSKIIITK